MSAVPASLVCERSRAQISLDLDGELSLLERRMLSAHLLRCDDCRAFSDEVHGFTQQIRSAPLESPEHPVVVHRSRRGVQIARVQVGVAAVIAIATVGVAAHLSGSTEGRSTTRLTYETSWNLSPNSSVMEREQAILDVVKPGRPLPPSGSIL